ncbi:hypothetical protein [Indibacter alkaliphilus]|uniref:hypothetical protein n=1 Tax=Indibacter alkaliphilus TaxID=579922 RepID=UPI00028230E4|nr:hypothetical protein [Indibacter alkaliphilus]
MKKISNNEYRNLVDRWQESGEIKASFAEAEGISRTTIYYRCKKFIYSRTGFLPPHHLGECLKDLTLAFQDHSRVFLFLDLINPLPH